MVMETQQNVTTVPTTPKTEVVDKNSLGHLVQKGVKFTATMGGAENAPKETVTCNIHFTSVEDAAKKGVRFVTWGIQDKTRKEKLVLEANKVYEFDSEGNLMLSPEELTAKVVDNSDEAALKMLMAKAEAKLKAIAEAKARQELETYQEPEKEDEFAEPQEEVKQPTKQANTKAKRK
jgi:hypothetical protein